ARFASGFAEGPAGWRTVGREAEYPVVRADGTAAEISALWMPLAELAAERGHPLRVKREGHLVVALEGAHFTFFSEVGRGTIEVLTGPRDDLVELAQDHEDAMGILLDAAAALGFSVLGYGIQPRTPATGGFMMPKARYGVLWEAIGDPWLWFTLTASDQVHARIARDEVVPLSNTANLLSGVTVALTANSPVFADRASGFMSAREGYMREIHAADHRHGMTGGPVSHLHALVRHLAGQRFLMELRQGADGSWRHEVFADSFAEWLARYGDDPAATGRQSVYDAFMLHEHYIWNSARPRSNHGTLEMRAACQQPWVEPGSTGPYPHMAASALGVALVCAGETLAEFIDERLGPDTWPTLRAYHAAAVRDGLAASEPAPGFLRGVLERCADALEVRGRGEEQLLAPLWARLDTGRNPAQRALALYEQHGIDALVDSVRIRR
ncbi:MAG: hypothetical protein D6798_13975, partial [Deltaproteobacteria bacterium]